MNSPKKVNKLELTLKTDGANISEILLEPEGALDAFEKYLV